MYFRARIVYCLLMKTNKVQIRRALHLNWLGKIAIAAGAAAAVTKIVESTTQKAQPLKIDQQAEPFCLRLPKLYPELDEKLARVGIRTFGELVSAMKYPHTFFKNTGLDAADINYVNDFSMSIIEKYSK